uniref:Putative secreted protein n=1 Tax=Ixodes ricinus TaxID=34613 RepID=A0A6B0UFM3_IXORI
MISGSSAVLTVTLVLLCLFEGSKKTGSQPDTGPDGTSLGLSKVSLVSVLRVSWLVLSLTSGGLSSDAVPTDRVGSMLPLVDVTGPS